ncbi:hypothetical protein LG299_10640 [Microbacterium lacus]|uniref:AAA family ATPase n=1 Tax=Microbacterium lacus TaxID=415217 RepID=UPI00384E1DEB
MRLDRLDDLGPRICVLGPSGSGKSTLAQAIGNARGIPVVHLDQYRHLEGTQWELRPDEQFERLHDAAVASERWVIDGNYSKLMPQRLAMATGVILLDISTARSLARYVRRTLTPGPRAGGLEGTRDRLSWDMVHFISVHTRPSRRRRREVFERLEIPKLLLPIPAAVSDFYRNEGLVAPTQDG